MTATVEQVAAALQALGHGTKTFPADPPDVPCAYVNVWHADDPLARYPADTVLAPTADDPTWTWGPNYEHRMLGSTTADQVAQAVSAGLSPRT